MGKCHYADTVYENQLLTTTITGIHIAAAVGTERAVKENLAQCFGYMSELEFSICIPLILQW